MFFTFSACVLRENLRNLFKYGKNLLNGATLLFVAPSIIKNVKISVFMGVAYICGVIFKLISHNRLPQLHGFVLH